MHFKGSKLFVFFGVVLHTILIAKVTAQKIPDSVTTITVDALSGLQFDKVRFLVKPGSRVQVIFANTDDMSHNLLITKPGTRLEVVNAALKLGDAGPKMDYIPKIPQVLWSIPTVSPNETKSITFTAPKEQGIYPYVCTFPGHGFVMYGAMYVSKDAIMPPLKSDINIPSARRDEAESTAINPSKSAQNIKVNHTNHTDPGKSKVAAPLHPYTPVPPYFYRVYMEGSSPAAVAVSLPHELSYCWDAGTCRLRYAWQGGFLDNSELWKGKGDVWAKVVGTIFYRDKTEYPLRVGKPDELPQVNYKGIKLINRYPEFQYTLNGTAVFELIRPKEDGTGLVRTFRIPDNRKDIWFCFAPEDGVLYEASAGQWENGKLKLTAQQARQFTIIMTKKKGVKL